MLTPLHRDKDRVYLFAYWTLIETNYSVKSFVHELHCIAIDIYIFINFYFIFQSLESTRRMLNMCEEVRTDQDHLDFALCK